MQLQLTPTNKLIYKLKLSPQMRLNISLLQMPLNKLKEHIKQQAEENPLLNMENVEVPQESKEKSEEDLYIGKDREFESGANYNSDDEEKQNYRESLMTKPPTLTEHLLRQLRLLTDSDDDYKIGELIIGNIDDNGYLRSSVEDIAESSQIHTSKVEKVLFLIQTFDPIGIGVRDLRECLLLQLKAKGEENSLAGQIVDKYLSFLEKKRFDYIAKKLSAESGSATDGKVSVERIKEALKEIAHLEPKPGRSFNTERTIRLIPDAMLRKNKDKYEITMNDWELPRVTLNAKYKQMIRQKGTPEDVREYLKERLKAAHLLINAVHKRKETIRKIMEEIVYLQKDFLDNGVTNFKPMTLEQIAKRIDKHKSTVSRAVNGKYLQTSWGILELRSFLNSGVRQESGELFSSKTIKSKIKDLIVNENKENPLGDKKIVELLKQEGISISRRTIAKYRNQLKILPSKSRR